MAQRILEKRIISISEDVGSPGNFWLNGEVDMVDTNAPAGAQVVTAQVIIAVAATDTMAQMEANRSAAYRAACVQAFGSAPASAILLALKAV